FQIYIGLTQKVSYEKLKEFFNKYHIVYNDPSSNIEVYQEELPGSFIDLKERIIVVSEDAIFSTKQRHKIRYQSVINQAVKVRDASELTEGDYIVQYDFGIGQYMGLKTMDLSGQKRDYLYIIYDNNEALYVPTDQIDLILKYRSHEDLPPKLSKLSGKQWS